MIVIPVPVIVCIVGLICGIGGIIIGMTLSAYIHCKREDRQNRRKEKAS